jgi:hypothetical protein
MDKEMDQDWQRLSEQILTDIKTLCASCLDGEIG